MATKKYATPQEALFAYCAPCGIVYCDRRQEKAGDYKKVGFLSYSTLKLDLYEPRKDIKPLIEVDAKKIQDRKGQLYTISGAGQQLILGGGK